MNLHRPPIAAGAVSSIGDRDLGKLVVGDRRVAIPPVGEFRGLWAPSRLIRLLARVRRAVSRSLHLLAHEHRGRMLD